MSMTIKEWMKRCYDVAQEKGWHDKTLEIQNELMNFHAEISEAWEELRKGNDLYCYYFEGTYVDGIEIDKYYPSVDEYDKATLLAKRHCKPEGFPIEIADLLIRIFHTCAYHGIDIEKYMELKEAYNKTRPYRHGNKVC